MKMMIIIPVLFSLATSFLNFEVAGAQPRARLEPKEDGYFGLNLDWENDSPKKVFKRFGFKPKVYVRFFSFTMSEEEAATLKDTAKLARKQRALLLVTLEPWGGLSSVTDAEAERHAKIIVLVQLKH